MRMSATRPGVSSARGVLGSGSSFGSRGVASSWVGAEPSRPPWGPSPVRGVPFLCGQPSPPECQPQPATSSAQPQPDGPVPLCSHQAGGAKGSGLQPPEARLPDGGLVQGVSAEHLS